MSIVSDVTSAIGSACANVSSAVSSATYSVASTISNCFTAVVNGLSSAANTAGAALKKGWNFTVSTYSDNKKVANIALATIATAGAVYAGRNQIAAIPAAVCNLIGRK